MPNGRTKLAAAKTGFDMGIQFNELNRVLDLGFKPIPWGDIGYLPTKYQPQGQSESVQSSAFKVKVQSSRSPDPRPPRRSQPKALPRHSFSVGG